MQNLRTVINYKPFSHFGAFSNKCTKSKKSHLKSDTGAYLFGFNGKENDDEVKGGGGQQDYGMRIHDTRLGRFLSVDPISYSYPMLTPYQFASNRPIDGVDLDGLEYATFTILVVDGKVIDIAVTTDYELKNENTKGPGIQYDYVYVNSVENTVQTKSEFKKNLHGIYQGGDNPKLPKIGGSPSVVFDDYSLEPIDETDATAKQHDKDYDKVEVAGVSGILSDKSTEANVKYIYAAKKIVDKYVKGEKDAITGKPVTKETKEAAEFGMYWFITAEDYKGKDEYGNPKDANPIDFDPGQKY
jgi:RHS repeat-associated protein